MSAMERAIGRVAGRVRLAIARAVVNLVNDATKMQTVQVQLGADQVRDRVEHFQHYGFTSVPLPGAEGIGLAVGGSTDHLVVINVDDRRYRITLQAGEVALYDDQGQCVKLGRDGMVHVKANTLLKLEAPGVQIVSATFTHNGVNVGATHVHGGIQPGPGSTSPPS